LCQIHGDVLRQMLGSGVARDQDSHELAVHSSISAQSVRRIQELIAELKPRRSLEIGCAMGTSTLAILYALQRIGSGAHVASDPNQTGRGGNHWNGMGLVWRWQELPGLRPLDALRGTKLCLAAALGVPEC